MLDFPIWKRALIMIIAVYGLLYALPNFTGEWHDDPSSYAPGRTINLGLDLQGGAHLLLQVDLKAVDEELTADMAESLRLALREQRVGYKNLNITRNTISITLRDPEKLDKAIAAIRTIDANLSLDNQGARLQITLPDQMFRDRQISALQQSLEIIRRRVDEFGAREPTIQQQGLDRIIVQVPGIDDPERLKATIGKTAKMSFHMVPANYPPGIAIPSRLPSGTLAIPSRDRPRNEGADNRILIEKRSSVGGDHLVDAQATFQDSQPVVSFRFDGAGANKFGRVTQDNVGRYFAIVLDQEAISAPTIREPILGGSGVISGNFSVQEAQDLALLLRAGALPAPIKVLEERTVGPGLGEDSIAAGILASIVGMLLIGFYMVGTYGLFGCFAVIALLLNITLIISLLSTVQATLTLPGIAGIVLTMGMAVDANVLIFERIREESRLGYNSFNAVSSGYQRALTTIIDSNLTTLFAAICLFLFGSGPIKGFSVTLSIGIITSMFTSIMVTRWMVVAWLKRTRSKTIPL